MGRIPSADMIYARELGFNAKHGYRIIQRLGGCEKLRSLSPEARGTLLAHLGNGNSQELHRGGLRARGMLRAKDIRIREEV